MFSGLQLVTPPVAEPVTVADAKAHSRIFISADESLLAGYIAVARQRCEHITKRAFMPQTWRYSIKHWPGRNYNQLQQYSNWNQFERWKSFEVPLPPLVSISSFTYIDTAGNTFNMQQGYTTAVGNYLLNTDSEPGRISLPFAGIWPTTILLPTAMAPIQLTYLCGYSAFAGTVAVDATGVATWQSGDRFAPSLNGTWINVGGVATIVQSVTDDSHLQLASVSSNSAIDAADSNVVPYTANSVPMAIRQAILYLTAHYYQNREPVVTGRSETAIEVPQTVDDLLAPYRVHIVGTDA